MREWDNAQWIKHHYHICSQSHTHTSTIQYQFVHISLIPFDSCNSYLFPYHSFHSILFISYFLFVRPFLFILFCSFCSCSFCHLCPSPIILSIVQYMSKSTYPCQSYNTIRFKCTGPSYKSYIYISIYSSHACRYIKEIMFIILR